MTVVYKSESLYIQLLLGSHLQLSHVTAMASGASSSVRREACQRTYKMIGDYRKLERTGGGRKWN